MSVGRPSQATDKVEKIVGTDSGGMERALASDGTDESLEQTDLHQKGVEIAIQNCANRERADCAEALELTARELGESENELRRLNRTLQAHSKSDQAMMRAADEPDYLQEVCKIIVETCGHLLVWIGYAENDEAKSIRPVASAGFEEGYLSTLNLTWADTDRGRGPTGTAIRTGTPSTCRNMLTDPRFEPWRDEALRRGYASSIVFPLSADGRVFGAITIYSRDPDPFSEDETALLSELAKDLSYGITAIRTRQAKERAEQALKESEQRVRLKLDSILSPEGSIGDLALADILDIQSIQAIMDSFYELAHIPMAIIDLEGRVLVGVGWQDICTKFHRVHPESCAYCINSDTQLTKGVAPGEFKLYKCQNNMWDVATPIMVGGEHVGNLFSGQFFFDDEPVDHELFRFQAQRYGFDVNEYIAALERVPRLSRKSLNDGMAFFIKLADLISKLSYGNIKLARSLTQRNALTESLSESEATLRGILEAAQESVWLFSPDGTIRMGNKTALERLGRSAEEVIGRRFNEIAPAEVVESRMDRLTQVVRSGQPIEFEDECAGIGFLHNFYPVLDAAGRVTHVAGFSRDITERKRAEDQLKKYRMLSNHTRDVILFIAMDGRIVEANDAAVDAYGYTRDELLTLTVFDLRDSGSREHAVDQMAAADLGGVLFETEHCRKDGTSFPVEVSSCGTEIGGERVLLSVIRDISVRKDAEEELSKVRAEAERRAAELQSFMDNVEDGMSLVDADGSVVWMNRAGRVLFQVPDGENFSDWVSQYQRVHLDGRPIPTEEAIAFRVLRGEPVTDFRYKAITPRGTEIYLCATGTPLWDRQGGVVGATFTFRSIAEELRLERERETLLEREHHIAEVLQNAILPQELPSELTSYRIAAQYRPALNEAEIGGDFYDIFDLSDGRFGVLIGDVVGKGLAAAIRVASARHAVRSYAYLDPRPARVLARANDALCKDAGDESRLLTLFYAVVDPGMGGIMYASAGHEPPVVCSASGECEELVAGGMAFGVIPGITYEQMSRPMRPNDVIVMVTDGITEARAPGPKLFGKEGMIAFVRQHRRKSPEEIATGLMHAATAHAGGRLQDDAAVVVLTPNTKKTESQMR